MGDYVIAHEEVHFNPRSREGSDELRLFFYSWLNQFQSTLPRRERLYKVVHEYCNDDFNPRSREGSDYTRAASAKHSDYFNPRSREGSDEDSWKLLDTLYISIHAPAKGATVSRNRSRKRIIISIHAPAKGATTLKSRR